MFPEIVQVVPNENYTVTVYFEDEKLYYMTLLNYWRKRFFNH